MSHTQTNRRRSQVQAVFWDIDGTLIDSEPLHFQVIADWCKTNGLSLNAENNLSLLGKSMLEKWEYLKTLHDFSSDFHSFSSGCAQMYCDRVHSTMQRPDTMDVFLRLAAMRIPQACVSNGDRSVVEANLNCLGIMDKLAFFLTGEDLSHTKPHPEPYRLAVERLFLEPENCLAIEDSQVGVSSASAAKLVTLAWPMAETDCQELYPTDYCITNSVDFPWKLFAREENKNSGHAVEY